MSYPQRSGYPDKYDRYNLWAGLDVYKRQTIFDYWSVDTIRRWRNGGKFDGKMLTEEHKRLYSIYQRVLTLCNEETSIAKGVFFDLMYANKNGWRFDEHKQYTFMRKYKNELLFIIVNFDSQLVDVAINVPSHAFDFLQIPQMEKYQACLLYTSIHCSGSRTSMNKQKAIK